MYEILSNYSPLNLLSPIKFAKKNCKVSNRGTRISGRCTIHPEPMSLFVYFELELRIYRMH